MEILAIIVLGIGLVLMAASSFSGSRSREARRLAAIERKLGTALRHLGIEEPQPEEPDVVQLLEQGKKIQAVKVYRERTGLGLPEAKDVVDRIARKRGLER
jgi:ribosomal protein L7/L12